MKGMSISMNSNSNGDNKKVLHRADILIPDVENMKAWSVVACDQYTSEPEYWDEVKKQVGGNPSTLNMIFPEIYLKTADFKGTIADINAAMHKYLSDNIFKEYKNSYIYIERKLKNGSIRKGIIGMIDLECYDFSVGSQSAIRATEGTVLERIPPRVAIREDAPLELPHVMLLIDDESKAVIESIGERKSDCKQIYSFDMMLNSGSISGYLLPDDISAELENGIDKLADGESFKKRYGAAPDKGVLLFAVGDGNHSLATARQCYLNLKEKIGSRALECKARYALVELVNLHDASLEFEAIHRVVFNVDAEDMLEALGRKYALSECGSAGSQRIDVVIGKSVKTVYITNPTLNLAVGSLQEFIDEYLKDKGEEAEVDYIHGENVVKSLCSQGKCIGFILPCMDKNDLFKTVILDGALPRKTFSMGEACDKRFYLESRRITE